MKKFLTWFGVVAVVLAALAMAVPALPQNPQTQTAPIYSVNAKYTNGTAPGYWATQQSILNGSGGTIAAATGLHINIGPGTANCGSGTMIAYAGGTFTMTASTTNRIYLNTASSCAVTVKTSAFVGSDIPLAVVVTSGSAITSITDERTIFNVPPGASVAWGVITGTLSDQTDLQAALNAKAAASSITTINSVACALNGSCTIPTGSSNPNGRVITTSTTAACGEYLRSDASGAITVTLPAVTTQGCTTVVQMNGNGLPTIDPNSQPYDGVTNQLIKGTQVYIWTDGTSFHSTSPVLPGAHCSLTTGVTNIFDCSAAGAGLPLDPSGTIRDWIGSSWLLVNSTPELITTAYSTNGSSLMTITAPNTGVGAIAAGQDFLLDADSPCLPNTMARAISANTTTITTQLSGCPSISGTAFHIRNGNASIPEWAQNHAANFVGHGTTNNYAIGGIDCAYIDTNYTSVFHTRIAADQAAAAAASAPLYIYGYCTATSFDTAHLNNIWQKLHAEGANVQVNWLGIGTASGDPSDLTTAPMANWKALNDFMYGSQDPINPPGTGMYLERYIDIDPQTTSNYCPFSGGGVHLSNTCTEQVSNTVAGKSYPFPNTSGVNLMSTNGQNNWNTNTTFQYQSLDGNWYAQQYVGIPFTNYYAGWGWFYGSKPAFGGMIPALWHHQSAITPGSGECFGLYPTFGNDHTTQPIDVFLARASSGRLQVGTTCGGVDGYVDASGFDFQATSAPTGSCTVPGRLVVAKDWTGAVCGNDSVWHSFGTVFTPTATNIAAPTYVADSGSADNVLAVISPAVLSYTTGLRLRVKIAADNATTTPTLTVNALTSKTIVKGASSALVAGDLKNGAIAEFTYNGTNFQLMNPLSVAGGASCGTANIPCTNTANTFNGGTQTNITVTPATVGAVDEGSSAALVPAIAQTAVTLNTGAQTTITYSSNITAGNAEILYIAGGNGNAYSSVSSSTGATFTRVFNAPFGDDSALFYACNVPGGAETLTPNRGGAMVAIEVSGVAASCFDNWNSSFPQFNTSTWGPVSSTTTTTQAGDILISGVAVEHGTTTITSSPTGYSSVGNALDGGNYRISVVYKIAGAAGTYNDSSWNGVSSGNWGTDGFISLKANTSAVQSADLRQFKKWDGTVLGAVDANGRFRGTATTVSALPTCNAGSAYTKTFVTDASSPTFNATVTGGSSTKVPVYCDGTNWKAY